MPPWSFRIARMGILYALHRLDVRLFLAVFKRGEVRLVRPVAKALSRSADGYLYVLLPALLWLLGAGRVPDLVLLLGAALATERCLYWLLKNGLRRPRPQDFMPDFRSLVVAADKFSFPSGHTSAAFLLATSLAVVYGQGAVPLYVWASTIALSRVILGVHYPGDTLAGALMGTATAVFVATQLGLQA